MTCYQGSQLTVSQMEPPAGGQKENTEPLHEQRGDQDDSSGLRRRRDRVGAEHVGGVAAQNAAMEQPTNSFQASTRLEPDPEHPSSRQRAPALPANNRFNGSYHCERFKKTPKCDFCYHMVETSSVLSSHFKRRHAVAGHNVHSKATEKVKLRWFVYLQEMDTLSLRQR